VFERFTDRARSVLVIAQDEARRLHHGYIGTEHILLGLVRQADGVAAEILTSIGVTVDAVRSAVEAMLGESHDPAVQAESASPPFTPRAKKVLELSLREALQLGHNYIGTEHILLGIIREGEGVAAQVLAGLGVDLAATRQSVIAVVSGQQREGYTGNPPGRAVTSQFVHADREGAEPRCPQCRADLSEGARFRTILVQPDASSVDESPLRTYVVYCGKCGISLHMFTPAGDTPGRDTPGRDT
jgi:ATP-dependent Clp protease ATP-binding subunit ClpC